MTVPCRLIVGGLGVLRLGLWSPDHATVVVDQPGNTIAQLIARHRFDTLGGDLDPVAELRFHPFADAGGSPADAQRFHLVQRRTGKRGLLRKQRNKRGMQ